MIGHCFFHVICQKGGLRIIRARLRRVQMYDWSTRKEIFQTLNIDEKEMLVIYKNNVYDITPKQDEISVIFIFIFFHVVHFGAAVLCTTPTEKLGILSRDIPSAPKSPIEKSPISFFLAKIESKICRIY